MTAALQVAEIDAERADILRQRRIVEDDLRRVNAELKHAWAGQRAKLHAEGRADLDAIGRMDERLREIAVEKKRLAADDGAHFERAFMIVARESLTGAEYEKLIAATKQRLGRSIARVMSAL